MSVGVSRGELRGTKQYLRFDVTSALVRHVRFIFHRTVAWSSLLCETLPSIDLIMGNALQRGSSADNDIPTPKIAELTPAEVKIIKESWKIPSANVSTEM